MYFGRGGVGGRGAGRGGGGEFKKKKPWDWNAGRQDCRDASEKNYASHEALR